MNSRADRDDTNRNRGSTPAWVWIIAAVVGVLILLVMLAVCGGLAYFFLEQQQPMPRNAAPPIEQQIKRAN